MAENGRIRIMAAGAREKFTDWIANRGGVAKWRNINLSNPDGGDMYTPANTVDGNPCIKPHWGTEFAEKITDMSRFQFTKEAKEVKRFRVALRRSANGLQLKCTDASTRKIRKNIQRLEEKLHTTVTYHFDYNTQECVLESIAWED